MVVVVGAGAAHPRVTRTKQWVVVGRDRTPPGHKETANATVCGVGGGGGAGTARPRDTHNEHTTVGGGGGGGGRPPP